MVEIIPFVNEVNMEKASDNITPIRGGSVGINEILGYLKASVLNRRKSQWNLFLINAFTFCRNIYTKDMTYSKFYESFIKECDLFYTYLESYLSHFKYIGKYPVIIYFPDYNKIPQDIKRDHPDSYLKMLKLYDKLKLNSEYTFKATYTSEFIKTYMVRVGKYKLPYHELMGVIRNILNSNKEEVAYSLNDPVFLLSHCNLDLYIVSMLKQVELVESYTAEIKTYKNFGSRLTKECDIPFIWATHRLFGDKTHINALVSRNKKKEIIEVAIKNKWVTKSKDQIIRDICNTLKIDRTVFTSFSP